MSTAHLQLVPWLRVSGTIPPFLLVFPHGVDRDNLIFCRFTDLATMFRWFLSQVSSRLVQERRTDTSERDTLFSSTECVNVRWKLFLVILSSGRYQCPRGLRRRSAAARPMRLWVWILQGACIFVCCECCVCCQVGVFATS